MVSFDNVLHPVTPTKKSKSQIIPYQCRICEAPAKCSFYDVISCESCKVFFRRSAQRKQNPFICNFNGDCQIDINTRNICKSCRLAKCFKNGMSTDKFRGPMATKSKKNALARVVVQHQPARLPILNLLQSDQSLLTADQWVLLSNLFNCYKDSQILPFTQRLICTHNTSKYNYTIYEKLVDEFLVSVYETAGTYLHCNDDIRHLPADDRSIILRGAADNVTCMGGAFIMQSCHLYALDSYLNAMNTKYGKQTMDIHIDARKYIDTDTIINKLAIGLFAFSENTGCYYYTTTSNDVTNPINILNIQNKYAELTWKYLLYRYGYQEAIKRFLNIALWLTSMNVLAVHAQTLAAHLNDINSIIEQTEIQLILDDVEHITQTN